LTYNATYSDERGNPPLLRKHDFDVPLEGGEAPLNDSPYNLEIHAKVLVNEDIPQRRYAAPWYLWVSPFEIGR
jgi:hypothetical protein